MNSSANFYRSLFTGLIVLIYACKGPETQNQPTGPIPVSLQPVKFQVAVYHDSYPGNIVALNEVQLRSEVNGFITGIFFKEGQVVQKGQILYEIEKDRYAATVSQAEAGVKIAKSNLEKTKKDAERYRILDEKEAIAKQKLEYANNDYRNAKQQLASAKADLTKAVIDLTHATIRAPFDGTIGISPVKLGTFITAGQTILNTISSDNPIAADFTISEKDIPHFMQLKDINPSPKDSVFTISLPNKSIYEHPGQIELFDRAVDRQTGTLKIRLQFPNSEHHLKTGMSCEIRVLNKTDKKVILVPYKAITEQMGEFFVYVAEKDTARQRKVSVGATVGPNAIILSGITEKDSIIAEGIQKLKEGAPVQTRATKEKKEEKPSSKK